MTNTRWTALCAAFIILMCTGWLFVIFKDLPRAYSLEDYTPPLMTLVLDRKGRVIGEFFKERRKLASFEEFPGHLIQAFISSEDGSFFEHRGVNYSSIFRALLANIKAGRKVQGGSTITQQVARSLLLSSKKTYTRKIKEVVLAKRMERYLTKKEILYLYLNQIYLGHGAYGVGMASHIYFKKEVKDLTLEESALLAGLPQAPSRFSPISNAQKAKERQRYVLFRMAEEKYISEEQAQKSLKKPIQIFMRQNYSSRAPYFVETLRQLLIEEIGEERLLTGGLTIHSALDLDFQEAAQEELKKGLKELDKRQGFRGALKNISEEEQEGFFAQLEKKWVRGKKTHRILLETGQDGVLNSEFETLQPFDQVKGVVQKVEPHLAYIKLMFGFKGVISLETSQWARKPNPNVNASLSQVRSLQSILKKGDVVWVRLEDSKDHSKLQESLKEVLKQNQLLTLEQEPEVQGALISFDQNNQDIVAMVGGYDFSQSQFNRTYQSRRQPGSAFKPIIYSAALDKGFTPNSIISDEPVVYEDEEADLLLQNENKSAEESDQAEKSKWKPFNYSKRFSGDILFRNALIRSLNIPTIKLIERIGIPWIEFYSRRLGIMSPLNTDYTMALGSSSITLYEMTKAFSIFAGNGVRIRPVMANNVKNADQSVLLENLSLDQKFIDSLAEMDKEFEKSWEQYWASQKHQERKEKKSAVFFKEKDQVLSQETAYLITSLLQGVIFDPRGTGARAKPIGRPAAGKTGTTNGYFDAWFIGYSPQITTGVWLGFDHEKSLGQSETGSRAALPIWYNYMKTIHESLEKHDFEVPENIVFAQIDNETGLLADASSKEVVRQAFLEGTEPTQQQDVSTDHEDQQFLRRDLSL